jgi:hypothetical protein
MDPHPTFYPFPEDLDPHKTSASTTLTNRGKKWSEDEEHRLFQSLHHGKTLAECAKSHGRSITALNLRIGSVLQSRSSDIHRSFPNVPPSILDQANRVWKEHQTSSSSSSSPSTLKPKNFSTPTTLVMNEQDKREILDAISDLRREVKKLRAQLKH